MKKICMILSIILIIISIYTLIQIDFVCSVKNGKMYDGFGYPYNNDKPNSPFTLVAYIELIGGISLFTYSKKDEK